MSNTTSLKRKRTAALGLGVLCASILTAGIAGASQSAAPSPATGATVTSAIPTSPLQESSSLDPTQVESELPTDDGDVIPNWEPTEDEIAEINAEVSKLTEALAEAGISFTLETDEFGLQYPEWDEADDEKAWEILEDVFGDMLIDDTEFDDADWDDADFDWQPTADEIAEINAEIANEVEALEAAGVTITMETDEFGISFPMWDESDEEAAMAVFEELYGPFEDFNFDDADFDFDDADFDDAEWEPTAEEIAEINELIKSEAKALTDAGISFTLETDEFGFEYPMWDATDEDAAWDALEALWEDEFDLFDGDPAGE